MGVFSLGFGHENRKKYKLKMKINRLSTRLNYKTSWVMLIDTIILQGDITEKIIN